LVNKVNLQDAKRHVSPSETEEGFTRQAGQANEEGRVWPTLMNPLRELQGSWFMGQAKHSKKHERKK